MLPAQTTCYSPCHITGFFSIHDQQQDPARAGSTGAGVSLERGVITTVSVRKAVRKSIKVEFNGRPLRNPTVSEYVVQQYLRRETREVKVSHRSRLPVGAGYGTSGAGALGLSLALNEALGNPVTELEAARTAHGAEVKCKTGLGTVTSVFQGGFVVRLKPGAPGVGKVRRLAFSRFDRVVSASFGPIYTPGILARPSLRARVNVCGKDLVGRLLRQPRTETFVSFSRFFADCLNLMSPRLRRLLKMMDDAGISSSMVMIGEGAFSVVHKDRAPAAAQLMRGAGLVPTLSKISLKGAHLL